MATDEDALLARAAEQIANADFLLVAAGAGFSADSGLPVYNDIAAVEVYQNQGLEYHDLCNTYWLDDDEEVFYGFWGSCLNSYRETPTHRGYDILRAWKNRVCERTTRFQQTFDELKLRNLLPATVTAESVTSGAFFVYTSNVDAHFHRHFSAKEIYELHGSLENWQCAGCGGSSSGQPCEAVWPLPPAARFAVDVQTMRADGRSITSCPECGGLARPNVLMFHDKKWIANIDDEDRYVAWEAVMEQVLEDDSNTKLVVLEIGCGMRVPSVRRETEMVVADAFTRCAEKRGIPSAKSQFSLIRINPDYPHCENELLLEHDLVVSIRSKALPALTAINELLPPKLG